MAEPLDPARYVPLAADAVGLKLAPEDLDSAIAAFTVLARVSASVMAFPLPEDVTSAAVFTAPEEGDR